MKVTAEKERWGDKSDWCFATTHEESFG